MTEAVNQCSVIPGQAQEQESGPKPQVKQALSLCTAVTISSVRGLPNPKHFLFTRRSGIRSPREWQRRSLSCDPGERSLHRSQAQPLSAQVSLWQYSGLWLLGPDPKPQRRPSATQQVPTSCACRPRLPPGWRGAAERTSQGINEASG